MANIIKIFTFDVLPTTVRSRTRGPPSQDHIRTARENIIFYILFYFYIYIFIRYQLCNWVSLPPFTLLGLLPPLFSLPTAALTEESAPLFSRSSIDWFADWSRCLLPSNHRFSSQSVSPQEISPSSLNLV